MKAAAAAAAERVLALRRETGLKSVTRLMKGASSFTAPSPIPGLLLTLEYASQFEFDFSLGSLPWTAKQERFLSSGLPRMAVDVDTGRNGRTTGGKLQPTPFLTDPAQLIASVDTFIFDCDGVIWKGNKLMDRVGETMDMLRTLGKRIYFLTNNSTKSRKQYGKKFESLGLNVTEDEVFSSGFAAVEYLKSVQFPANKKVYVISEGGVQNELEEAGFQWFGGPEDDEKTIELGPGQIMEHDHDVGAVVVGFDRHLNYYKLQ